MEYWILAFWFAVAIVALVVEIETTELVSAWFIVGAFITMIVAAIWPKEYIAQVSTFVLSSGLALVILRPILTKKLKLNKTNETDKINTMDGYKGFAETDIDEYGGKVNVNGTTWSATSTSPINEGDRIRVVRESNLTLIVEKDKE